MYGDSTRSLKAVRSQARPGWPVAPIPVPASTYHLSQEPITCPEDAAQPYDTYGRSSNPTWREVESALAQLEGTATALVFGSGLAAITAALRVVARPGAVLVVPADGYYLLRRHATSYLTRQGISVT